MMKRLALFALVLAVGGCAAPAAISGVSVAPALGVSQNFSGSTLEFGLDLYQRIAAEEAGNVAVSPVSIVGAMAPVADASRGATRAGIEQAMRFPQGEVMPAAGALLRSIAEDREGARVDIANALWVSNRLSIDPEFRAAAQRQLDAEVSTLDFTAAKSAADRINGWAEDKTEKRISGIVQPSQFDGMTRLVITNAVYLLADWADKFDPEDTRAADFFAPRGTVQAQLMQRDAGYRLIEDAAAQMVDLPYRDGRLTMSLILPRKRGGLPAFEKALTAKSLAARLKALDAAPLRPVRVIIPKVEFDASYQLNSALEAMGMGIAFSGRADLSGITGTEPLKISRVQHNTFLKVDEKGTEAAAVTAITIVTVGARVPPTLVFRADHPMMFVLRDRSTGAILFLGRVAAP